ncbi:hypothetical protein AB0N31_33765 [Streptomyces sp. NPDC051051]|uniref:hypothetical protein n=1 Tax=Streptomyces sp. NPDC051051 TaxID=3155666 RepID=UPI003430CE44
MRRPSWTTGCPQLVDLSGRFGVVNQAWGGKQAVLHFKDADTGSVLLNREPVAASVARPHGLRPAGRSTGAAVQRASVSGPRAVRGPMAGVLAAGVLFAALTGCSSTDDTAGARYAQDYAGHEPLQVLGHPSTGSLGVTQQLVRRIADGSADGLAALATGDGGEDVARGTADNWIKAFGKGAGGKVAADFHDEGSERQTVVLYFQDTGQTKEISVRLDGNAGEDGWHVLMDEPSMKEATAEPTWAPRTPGGSGSPPTR